MLRRRQGSTEAPCALLTLGRLPVALELARALSSEGWRVVVAEPQRWHLCRLSKAVAKSVLVPSPTEDPAAYLDALLQAVDREGVSLVVPVSEECPFVAQLHGRLSDGVRLVSASLDDLLSLHDKWHFAERARSLGLAVPQTALASTQAAADIAASGAHVIKRRLSCAGLDVVLHAEGRALEPALVNDQWIVQRRLDGESVCVSAMVVEGELRHLLAYRGLIEAGSVSVLFERVELPEEVVGFVKRFVANTRHAGMIGFDFLADDAGVWQAIECNPRATSGLHFMTPPAIVAGLLEEAVPSSEALQPLGARRQEAWSALAALQGAALRGRFSRADWRWMLTTRDIDWSLADPLPFLGMVPVNLPLLWRAWRAGRPMTEKTLTDIGWYETVDRTDP